MKTKVNVLAKPQWVGEDVLVGGGEELRKGVLTNGKLQ